MIKVLFVCHGNICRSTMAESVFTDMVEKRGREKDFEIASAGTSREEIGNPVHPGTVRQLRKVGIPVVDHRAVQMKKQDLEYYDYILGMDEANIRNIERIVGRKDEKIQKLLSFANVKDDIVDPWYTGDFGRTYADIQKGLEAFLKYLDEKGE